VKEDFLDQLLSQEEWDYIAEFGEPFGTEVVTYDPTMFE
jgi:hypothetical protein